MVMLRKDAPDKVVSLRLYQDQSDRLDHYALRIGYSRNTMILKLIDAGLEDLELMEKMGILGLGVSIKKFRENMVDLKQMKLNLADDL